MPKLLVFTATYNEIDNVLEWYNRVKKAVPYAHILVVDDNSNDGTRNLLIRIKNRDKKFNVIFRSRKEGLGSAHKIAFSYMQIYGFTYLLTMDADLSHEPESIIKFIKKIPTFDFIIGTRRNGGNSDYQGIRKALSYFANRAAEILLPTGLSEYTTSFRIFNIKSVQIILQTVPKDEGYAFFVEIVETLFQNGLRLTEIPINFKVRQSGKSKIPKTQIFSSSVVLLRLKMLRIFCK